MGTFIDRTGQIHAAFQIIKELGNQKVLIKCRVCGSDREYRKAAVVEKRATCKQCTISKNVRDKTGETYGSLQITKELGKQLVRATCQKCGHEDTYRKKCVTEKETSCKKCRTAINFKDRVGEIHGTFRITKELYNHNVICECLTCGESSEYRKGDIVAQSKACNKCKPFPNIKDRTGQTFGTFKVINELTKGKVIAQCLLCGYESNYTKFFIVDQSVSCKKCGLSTKFENKIINNIRIIELAYKGRDKNRYFNCKCNKCGEALVLTREEIIEYTCKKEV